MGQNHRPWKGIRCPRCNVRTVQEKEGAASTGQSCEVRTRLRGLSVPLVVSFPQHPTLGLQTISGFQRCAWNITEAMKSSHFKETEKLLPSKLLSWLASVLLLSAMAEAIGRVFQIHVLIGGGMQVFQVWAVESPTTLH